MNASIRLKPVLKIVQDKKCQHVLMLTGQFTSADNGMH